MANKQSRRSVSLNRELYIAASKLALRRDITLAQLVTDALRAYGVVAPETQHFPAEVAQRAAQHRTPDHQQHQGHRAPIVGVPGKLQVRIVESFLRVERPGPIRKSLGDAHANACGEPTWAEKIPQRRAAS